MDRISLLLPVHNEAGNIERVITDFYNELNEKIPLEIVIAEDGSTDRTKEILNELQTKLPLIVIMDDQRKGYMGGIHDGLQKVTGDYVLFCDSDGQHSPSDFWKLYELRNDFDIVSGWRKNRIDSFYRKIMSKVFQWLTKIFFDLWSIHDITAPFKLVKTEVAQKVSENIKYMVESYWTEFTIRSNVLGATMKEVPVKHQSRLSGTTKVYSVSQIPKIILSHLFHLVKIWWELASSMKVKNRSNDRIRS